MMSFFIPSRLIYRNGMPRSLAEEGDQERTQTQLGELSSAELPEDVKALARSGIFHESDRRHALVDRLLTNDLSPDRFREEYQRLENEETSWVEIFRVQRRTRERIRNLQERAESYPEMLPRKRLAFSSVVREVTRLNYDDLQIDTKLRSTLGHLTEQQSRQGAPPLAGLLSDAQVRTILEINAGPDNENFDRELNASLEPLQNTVQAGLPANIPGGATPDQVRNLREQAARAREAINAIRNYKKQEQFIERRVTMATRQLNRIIELNVSRAEREAERRRMLREAARFTGIRLEEGVTIRYQYDYRNDNIVSGNFTLRIQRVSMDNVPIQDHQNRVIGHAIGTPIIHLSNGQNMPLSRFKKWVDAANAYEDISSQDELLRHLGWQTLGIPLAPNTQVEYQKFARDRQTGQLHRISQQVRIREIHDNTIYFDQPVLYQSGPGLPGLRSDDEYRESLSYGEFLKWYNRQEVEYAFSITNLRERLVAFNREHNQEFNLRPKDNPPITLTPEEELYYPDDPMSPFRIYKVSPDRIYLTNGESFTPAQFFNWVKRNHVQKIPPKEKTHEELHKEHEEGEELKHETEKLEHSKKEYEYEQAEAQKKGPPGEPGGIFNFFKEAWYKTTFLSVKDFWAMILSIKEFVERRHKRKTQGRYAKVGSKLPGIFGPEFQRIAQAAETEEVNHFKEAMHQWGVFDVLERLYSTSDKDVAKACVMTLMEKGEMRWDSADLWKTLNRLTARYTNRGAQLYIPTDKHWLEQVGKNGEDYVGPAIDALWGTGTFAEWFQKNVSTYNSAKNNYEYKGKQLEADPKGTGGLRAEIKSLLLKWRSGEYVNPHEYEELIDFAIKYGKMSAEDKMFYMIMGVVTKNPRFDETLLHMDRLGDLDGKYLNQFPLLDFFTNKGVPRVDGTKGPWREHDFHHIAEEWFPDDVRRGAPGMQFSKFLWHVAMFDDNFRTRLSKGLRSAENMDHDDAHLFVPPSSYTEIANITGSPGGGEKKFFTPEGYANAYPGFSQYFITFANNKELAKNEEKRQQALRDALKSFVWYDAILDNRFKKFEGDKKARLADHHFNRNPVVDDQARLAIHRDQLRNLIREIGREYGMDFGYIFVRTGSIHDSNEKRRQEAVEKDIESRFLQEVDTMFERDGGRGVIEVIKRAKNRPANSATGLRGIRGWPLGKDSAVVATPEGEKKAKDLGLL